MASAARVRMYRPTWVEWTPGQLAVAAPFEACVDNDISVARNVSIECSAPSNDTRVDASLAAVYGRFKTLHQCAELVAIPTTFFFSLSMQCNTTAETLCLFVKGDGYIQCNLFSLTLA